MTTVAPALSGPPAGDPSGDPQVAVIVVSYGSPQLLRDNLVASGLGADDIRVVVVDNFSSAENRRGVESLGAAHGWTVVGLPDNRGFGAACNAGVAAAAALGCPVYLFLNPDARITPEVVRSLRAHSVREPLALISPRLVDSTGQVVFRAARTDLRDGRIHVRPASAGTRTRDPGDWLCAACVIVHEQLLRRIGGFDEGFFLYWEDVDLGYRAIAAGGSVILRDDLTAVHDEGATHGRTEGPAKTALYYRYNCRNRLAFAARHLGRRRLLRWMLLTPAVGWEIVLRGGRRQLLRSARPLWAATAGSCAGLALALGALVRGPGGLAMLPTTTHPEPQEVEHR
jgi:GT2 family glycosyltransferase